MCFEHFAVNGPIAKETFEAEERDNFSWDELCRDANIFWFVKGCTQIEIFRDANIFWFSEIMTLSKILMDSRSAVTADVLPS